jgi:hypothetical protein
MSTVLFYKKQKRISVNENLKRFEPFCPKLPSVTTNVLFLTTHNVIVRKELTKQTNKQTEQKGVRIAIPLSFIDWCELEFLLPLFNLLF